MILSELYEDRQMAPTNLYDSLVNALSTFLSLNLLGISKSTANLADGGAEKIKGLITWSKKPAVNGKQIFDLAGDKDFRDSPKGRAAVVKWIHGAIPYIEGQLSAALNDEGKKLYLPKIEKMKVMYKDLVSKQ